MIPEIVADLDPYNEPFTKDGDILASSCFFSVHRHYGMLRCDICRNCYKASQRGAEHHSSKHGLPFDSRKLIDTHNLGDESHPGVMRSDGTLPFVIDGLPVYDWFECSKCPVNTKNELDSLNHHKKNPGHAMVRRKAQTFMGNNRDGTLSNTHAKMFFVAERPASDAPPLAAVPATDLSLAFADLLNAVSPESGAVRSTRPGLTRSDFPAIVGTLSEKDIGDLISYPRDDQQKSTNPLESLLDRVANVVTAWYTAANKALASTGDHIRTYCFLDQGKRLQYLSSTSAVTTYSRLLAKLACFAICQSQLSDAAPEEVPLADDTVSGLVQDVFDADDDQFEQAALDLLFQIFFGTCRSGATNHSSYPLVQFVALWSKDRASFRTATDICQTLGYLDRGGRQLLWWRQRASLRALDSDDTFIADAAAIVHETNQLLHHHPHGYAALCNLRGVFHTEAKGDTPLVNADWGDLSGYGVRGLHSASDWSTKLWAEGLGGA